MFYAFTMVDYFDTNVIIYLVEGFSGYERLIDSVQDMLENDEFYAYTSELSICESLVKPLKIGAADIANLFHTFLEKSGCFRMIPIDKDILFRSAHISASTSMKTPDAIHVATAMASACDIFFTNDKNIRTPKGLDKVIFSDHLSN